MGASGTEEVELGAGAGAGTGGWACGPTVRTTYAGVYGGARHREETPGPDRGGGFDADLSIAVHQESHQLVDCGGDEGCDPPDDGVVPGVGARVGWSWRWFGVRAGGLALAAWGRERGRAWAVLPQLELGVGPEERFRGYLGYGSPLPQLARHPGLYLGATFPAGALRLDTYAGMFRTGPSYQVLGLQLVTAALLPVDDGATALRIGANLGAGRGDAPSYGASIGVVSRF